MKNETRWQLFPGIFYEIEEKKHHGTVIKIDEIEKQYTKNELINYFSTYIENIKHILYFRKIMKSNPDWKGKYTLRQMYIADIEIYRKIVLNKLYEIHAIDGKYGYLYSYDSDGCVDRVGKIDNELVDKFSHVKWSLSSEDIIQGNMNNITEDLTYHVYKEYNKDYDPVIHGKVIHKNEKNDDYNIENLYCPLYNQLKNRKSSNSLIYQGVLLDGSKFYSAVSINYGSVKKISKRVKYIEDAARDYNKLVIENNLKSKLNDIPNTKTTVYDLYDKKNLTEDFINRVKSVAEIKAIFYATEWIKAKPEEYKKINRHNIEEFKQKIKDFLRSERST